MEAVVPLEVEIPSLRVLMESGLEEAEWVKIRYEQLNMISERRLAAICHHQLYQRRMAKAYDRKVRPREFKEGDLVLRKILSLPGEDRSKLAPNYEGPYIVKKAFSGGALVKRCLQKKKKNQNKKKTKTKKTPKKYTITISHDLIDLIDLFYQNPFPYWSLKKLDLAF
jgi:hypothetical protein